MAEEEDILEMMEGSNEPLKKPALNQEQDNNKNMWDATDIKPVKIDIDNLNKLGKSFTVLMHDNREVVPNEAMEKLVKMVKVLNNKGYKFRYSGNKKDPFVDKAINVEDISYETYLPWNKFNEDAKHVILKKPTPTAYGIGVDNHKIFMDLPNPVKAILSSTVHLILGKTCTNPTDVVLCYSPSGAETVKTLKGKEDYKKTGNLVFPLHITDRSNITVFNLANSDVGERFANWLRDKENN